MGDYVYVPPADAVSINRASESMPWMPLREYAVAFIKFVRSFMTVERLLDIDWEDLESEEKQLIAPVITWATPQKAFSSIVTPLVNGQLATFGIAARFIDIAAVPAINGSKYLWEPVELSRTVDGDVEYLKAKNSRPMAFEATIAINMLTMSERDTEELKFRWQYVFHREAATISVYGITTRINWSGKWTNATEVEPGTGDKTVERNDTTVSIPFAYYPSEILETPETYPAIKTVTVGFYIDSQNINEDLEETIE